MNIPLRDPCLPCLLVTCFKKPEVTYQNLQSNEHCAFLPLYIYNVFKDYRFFGYNHITILLGTFIKEMDLDFVY